MHTLCLPVVNSLSDIFAGADVQAITCLLASMGTIHGVKILSHAVIMGVSILFVYSRGPLCVGQPQ